MADDRGPEFITLASLEAATKHMKTVCTRCGGEWAAVATGRSIWIRPFLGGPGRVAIVAEVYCPRCDQVPVAPSYGTPIYLDEVKPLDGTTRIHGWPGSQAQD